MVDILFYIIINIIFIGFLHGLNYTKNKKDNLSEIYELIDKINNTKKKYDDEIKKEINNILDENKKLNNKIEAISLSVDMYFKQQIRNINENHKKEDKNIRIIYKKGRNSELTIDKKYCNFPRSRNRGNCGTIIYTYEDACRHKKYMKDFNNINENKDIEKVIDDLNVKNNN